MKSTFCCPPYNNIRDAFIQLRKAGKYNKIIASPVIEKLLPLGQEIGFATRFGQEKEKKNSWTSPPWLFTLPVGIPKCYNSITGVHKAFMVPCLSYILWSWLLLLSFLDQWNTHWKDKEIPHYHTRTTLVGWSSVTSRNPSHTYTAMMVSQI